MSDSNDITQAIAGELAPELDRLIISYIDGGALLGSAQHTQLEGFLWDHKVGVLRIMQAHAAYGAARVGT